MKTNNSLYYFVPILLLCSIGTFSCNHKTQELPTPTVGFNREIIPILQASCAINSNCHSGVHNSGSNINFDSGTAYNNIISRQLVITSSPAASLLFVEVSTGIMPKAPYTPLSGTDINILLNWIKQGAKNN